MQFALGLPVVPLVDPGGLQAFVVSGAPLGLGTARAHTAILEPAKRPPGGVRDVLCQSGRMSRVAQAAGNRGDPLR